MSWEEELEHKKEYDIAGYTAHIHDTYEGDLQHGIPVLVDGKCTSCGEYTKVLNVIPDGRLFVCLECADERGRRAAE